MVHISGVLREFGRCFGAKMVVGGLLRYMHRPVYYKTVCKDGFQKKNRRFVARNPGSTRVYIGVHAGLCPLRLDSAHSGRGGLLWQHKCVRLGTLFGSAQTRTEIAVAFQ